MQLIKVQDFDKEIFDLRKSLARIPEEIKEIKAACQEQKKILKEAEDEFKSYQSRQKEKENDLASKEDNIKKLEAQLNLVKTNKEYAALQSEINNLKADDSILEEQILEFLEEGDSYKKKIEAAKQKIREAEEVAAAKEKTLTGQKQESEKKLGELETERCEIVKDVDPQIFSLYERVLRKKEGLALVPARDGGCTACGMQLRAQLADELHKPDRVVVCEKCSRILYIESKA